MAMSSPTPSRPTADDSVAATRPMSLWPDQPQALDSAQAAFVMTAFDPQQAETLRQREQLGSQLAVCQAGLSLRLVLAVQAVVALGAVWPAQGWRDALLRLAGPAVAALGGTLWWLALVCSLRQRIAHWPLRRARRLLLAMGALAALAGWGVLLPLGLAQPLATQGLLAGLLGALLAGVTWHWLQLREAAARPVEAHARLAELQSRIRPHFLFNALNTALALVQVDPVRAEAVLEDLSALFRAALAETGTAVTLDDELDLAQRYLAIEKIRFANRLNLDWDLDPAAGSARLPPLVLQPLVENAVRHGVEPSARGGGVMVRTRAHRGMVELEVVNTVPEEPGEPGTGMALANVRERLRLLHDVAGELHTWVEDGQHHARITVPL
jgi:two-component system, LytTR family, sensor histidine kinase AlgZ